MTAVLLLAVERDAVDAGRTVPAGRCRCRRTGRGRTRPCRSRRSAPSRCCRPGRPRRRAAAARWYAVEGGAGMPLALIERRTAQPGALRRPGGLPLRPRRRRQRRAGRRVAAGERRVGHGDDRRAASATMSAPGLPPVAARATPAADQGHRGQRQQRPCASSVASSRVIVPLLGPDGSPPPGLVPGQRAGAEVTQRADARGCQIDSPGEPEGRSGTLSTGAGGQCPLSAVSPPTMCSMQAIRAETSSGSTAGKVATRSWLRPSLR